MVAAIYVFDKLFKIVYNNNYYINKRGSEREEFGRKCCTCGHAFCRNFSRGRSEHFCNNPDAKIFIANTVTGSSACPVEPKLCLEPIGAARIRSPSTEGRNSPESRSSYRNDAETTTYFCQLQPGIAEVPLRARIYCLI